ncbi:MAG: hypothetical protein ACO3LE_07725 [Bdellovibrionota bacterium]|jgi:hypothetical protein
MKYKLRDEDYLDLYGVLTPEEIKEEFGEMSPHPRTIRRRLARYGRDSTRGRLNAIAQAKDALPSAFNLSKEQKIKLLKEALAEEKESLVRQVWQRAKAFEERWD